VTETANPPISGDEIVEERRLHILTSAVSCISRQGFAGVRLRDISREAGVSIGLIQHYFDTREELLNQAIRHASVRLLNDFRRAGDVVADPWERILILVELICTLPNLHAHSSLWLEFAGAVAKFPHLFPHLENVYSSWDSYIRAAVEEGTASGQLRPVIDIEDAVPILLAYFDGYEFDMATGLVDAAPEELRRRTVSLAKILFQPQPPGSTV
jgi:AcrR family transcriptional regulator